PPARFQPDLSASSLPLCPPLLNQLLENANSCKKTGFPSPSSAPVILCIGTDRLIGDSLGPLTGSLLEKEAGKSFYVYGTLDDTVHACNLTRTLSRIKKKHPCSTVIAVDASLGTEYKVGSVFIRPGSLKPGLGVCKDLPAAGDISITGIAGVQNSQPYLTLQTTRLSLIMAMAEEICACILAVCS
ncbi:MAG: spore protease YyaC, partial [Lachnospiraceae bacterium]|nr:spore protease YyaC [Lachnospiraceae bacterium]